MAKAKILIVDDQPGIRLLLSEVLEQEGYNVFTAETGPETLEKLQGLKVDLIILDYQLPVIDGLSIVRILDKRNCSIPVILMSGLPECLPIDPMEYENIVKSIAKPFDIEEILLDVEAALS